MTTTHEKERTLQRQIAREVEAAVAGVEVLAVELSSPERFTVFVDHPQGVDHALCVRVTEVLRDYLQEYAIDVSSPGLERPLRKPEHVRNAVGGHRSYLRRARVFLPAVVGGRSAGLAFSPDRRLSCFTA